MCVYVCVYIDELQYDFYVYRIFKDFFICSTG